MPSPTSTPETSPASDRAALVALYNAMDGANWKKNTNWLSDAPLNLWHGVKTDDNGRVTWLEFRWSGNGLRGTLPAELGNLTNLEFLELANNNLTGPLPAILGNLTKLEYLDLYGNSLTGPIPAELGNLTKLQRLNLHSNNLTGHYRRV